MGIQAGLARAAFAALREAINIVVCPRVRFHWPIRRPFNGKSCDKMMNGDPFGVLNKVAFVIAQNRILDPRSLSHAARVDCKWRSRSIQIILAP